MAFLFKSGDEIFDEGLDLIKRKEYEKARAAFSKCIEKGSSNSSMATIYNSIIAMIVNSKVASRYMDLANNLESCKKPMIEFGLTQFETAKMIEECNLVARYLTLVSQEGDAQFGENKGKELIRLGQEYQVKIGRDTLKTKELISGDTATSGIKESLSIQALGYETLAFAIVFSDPNKAAEYLQNAVNYRKQAGDDSRRDQDLVKAYSRSAKCWICGRTTMGEGVHFVAMSSYISPFMRQNQDDIQKSAPSNFDSVFVCKPCYSAISRRSDAIANKYYQDAISDLRATEARLMVEIEKVRAYASSIRFR